MSLKTSVKTKSASILFEIMGTPVAWPSHALLIILANWLLCVVIAKDVNTTGCVTRKSNTYVMSMRQT